MDIYCPKCGEPIDPYEFHDIADERGTTYTDISRAFRSNGCRAIGYRCSQYAADPRVSIAYELLGDDDDGAAAELAELPSHGILASRAAELAAKEIAR